VGVDSPGMTGTPESRALTRRLLRHCVAIYYNFRINDERRQFVHTAFLLAVEGRWLLMTAGHCVREIETARAQGGVLTQCMLIDSMGEGAVHYHPVPFPYDDAYPMHIGVNERIDYGVLVPRENTCHLLAANGIEPFDEDAWDTDPGEIQDLLLVGFPAELNVLQGDRVTFTASMFRVTRYPERPEDFPEEEVDIYFYGRAIEHPLGTLRGCSGGPIVAISPPDQEGTARYHLVAMQVSTLGRDIKGMLMPPLGQLIRELLRDS
jgi:hypothetical protein